LLSESREQKQKSQYNARESADQGEYEEYYSNVATPNTTSTPSYLEPQYP